MHLICDLHKTLLRPVESHGCFIGREMPEVAPARLDAELGQVLERVDHEPGNLRIKWELNGPDRGLSRNRWASLLFEVVERILGRPCDAARLRDICIASYDRLASPGQWEPYADTQMTLHALLQKGHTVSLLSNFDARGDRLILECLGDVAWQRIDLSHRTGLLKPESAAFLAHCRLLSLLPAAALMVGDDPWQDGCARTVGLAFAQVSYPDVSLRNAVEGLLHG